MKSYLTKLTLLHPNCIPLFHDKKSKKLPESTRPITFFNNRFEFIIPSAIFNKDNVGVKLNETCHDFLIPIVVYNLNNPIRSKAIKFNTF